MQYNQIMIKGCDVSHWNSIVNYANYKFCIIKATEGINYKDVKKEGHASNAKSFGCDLGFYHYARPDKGNNPILEAEYFLQSVKKYLGECVLALDWEQKSLNCDIHWARQWLDHIYKQTGIKPLFYCQASYTNRIDLIREGDYGLWVAQYNNKIQKPKVKDGKGYAIWQFTSRPIDEDLFNGNIEQFRKYM